MNPLFAIYFHPQFLAGMMVEVQRAWLRDLGWLR